MPQTRMFRDRVVSMEQTLEGGEKHLELLKSLCREALPDFEYRSHALDHERDLFVLMLESPDGRRKNVGWTRMVLFDAERIPALSDDGSHAIRARVVGFLRARGSRPEIVVTFRHLEEGWVETPEPRRERKRRRGGRGGGARGGRPQPVGQPAQAQKQRGAHPSPHHPQRAGGPGAGARGVGPATADQHPGTGPRAVGSGERPPAAGETGRSEGPRPSGNRRRRFRRRRRGRGGSGSGSPPVSPPARPAGGA